MRKDTENLASTVNMDIEDPMWGKRDSEGSTLNVKVFRVTFTKLFIFC